MIARPAIRFERAGLFFLDAFEDLLGDHLGLSQRLLRGMK